MPAETERERIARTNREREDWEADFREGRLGKQALVETEKAQSEARAKWGRTIDQTEPLPPAVVPADAILTGPLAAALRIRSLWPPPRLHPLHREPMAVVPATSLPALAADLDAADLYDDAGVACLILGEAKLAPDGNYHPLLHYDPAEAKRLTLLFREAQRVIAIRYDPVTPVLGIQARLVRLEKAR